VRSSLIGRQTPAPQNERATSRATHSVGAQWELPGAAARGNLGRRRAFCPDGGLGSSNRPFPRRRPRADVSERGGPGLPGPGGRTAPGEPPRPNRRWVRSLPRPNPILPSGTDAAGSGSKSSLKGGHGSRRRAFERADVCLPRPKARAKRWSLRANGHRNSHCAPTPEQGSPNPSLQRTRRQSLALLPSRR
jgi:hypothetical protein